MNLTEHYNQLYTKSSEAILAGNYQLDSQITNTSDSRFGITLLIRPSEKINNTIQLFLNDLKEVDAAQYYYPNSDIHITLLSIISCYEGFNLETIAVQDYVKIIQESLIDLPEIKIKFRGITASPSAVMIQGFPTDESLHTLRDKLRANFKKSTLQQSIDSRYSIATAHLTVVRFQEKLENAEQVVTIMEKFRDYDFGEFIVDKIELVYNDWYQRKENTKLLADFTIE